MYRNEQKFLVQEKTLQIMKSKLNILLKFDKNQVDDSYRIRSVYFDDYFDKSYYENDAGVEERNKFRIRVYDNPRKIIRLEIKQKLKGKNLKESCSITENQLKEIMDGSLRFDPSFPKPLAKYFLEITLNNLKPAVIVEYERTAYTYEVGNVRITFDRNISYSTDFKHFLDDEIIKVPLLEENQHVFEVKYDKLLPEFISQTIETGNLEWSTFSKYYLSRLAMEGEAI